MMIIYETYEEFRYNNDQYIMKGFHIEHDELTKLFHRNMNNSGRFSIGYKFQHDEISKRYNGQCAHIMTMFYGEVRENIKSIITQHDSFL